MQIDAGEREQGIAARADLITAIVLVAVGLFLFYESFTMPRLEARRIQPFTFPGLVPMLLSAVLTGLGVMLGIRAWKIKAPGGWTALLSLFGSMQAARVTAAAFLVLVFTLGLIGRIPFWAASMLFIFTYIITMEVVLTNEPVRLGRSAFWALVTAIVCGGGIYYLFASIFLVRLP